jgi:hypothetical protein
MDQVQAFTPILNYLSDSEMERNEKDREKEMNKRKKRATRGRRGVTLPDREPIRRITDYCQHGGIRERHRRHHTIVAHVHAFCAYSFCTEGEEDERIVQGTIIPPERSSSSCPRYGTDNVHRRGCFKTPASFGK